MPSDDVADPIRLLHLSDIHFRASRAWESDPVLRDLAHFIAKEVRAGATPDLVVITGDLAYAGKEEEYDLAGDWLSRELWPVLTNDSSKPLPCDRLLLVPGNHDVDRGLVGWGVRSTQQALLAEGLEGLQDAVAAVLGDPDERRRILKRHDAYLDFYGDWLGLPPGEARSLPWWQRRIEIRDQQLHIAGLDTAWVASDDKDRGRLLLGRYQIHQTVLHQDGDGVDWRLALLHHPWDYLAEFDTRESRQTIHLRRDLLLRGHLHEGEAAFLRPPDPSRACLELAAGCVYDGSRHSNAFQWVELWPAPKRVRILFRVWNKGAWQIDRNQLGCDQGEATFLLYRTTDDGVFGLFPCTPPPATNWSKYLDFIWKETAYIDIRGLVTGRPDAHRFPIGDLYIELQATGAEVAASSDGTLSPSEPTGLWQHPSLPAVGADGLLRNGLTNPRLVIVGDPGCGKTTFLRWVAHCLAADRLGRDLGAASRHLGLHPSPAGVPLPILVPIADWLDFIERTKTRKNGPTLPNGADWLAAYLGEHGHDANQGINAEDFRRLLDRGEAVILLDGLDEAPDHLQRRSAVRIIERLALAYPNCPLVVTSRPAAYRGRAVMVGFAHTTIEALDDAAIDGFLARWSRGLFPEHPERAAVHHQELAVALASRREIRLLARNTVMLTALAVVHWNDKRLPEQRAELYESIVRWLVEAHEQRPGRTKAQVLRQLLADLALAMQADPKGQQVQVTRRWAAERIAHRFDPIREGDLAAIERAERFLAEEEIDSGIVVRRGDQLRFWHLTFQEYLAAQALGGRDAERAKLLLHTTGDGTPAIYRPEWRETVLLLGGVLFLQGQERVDDLVSAVLDAMEQKPTRAAQARTAGFLGALVRDLSPFGYRPTDPRYVRILKAALAVFDLRLAPTIPLPDRIAAADALAQAGDPRLSWTHPQRWVDLPGGRFAMGAQNEKASAPGYDPAAHNDETPVHEVVVNSFRIARFPITVQEFDEFLDDEDYLDPRWWQAGGAGNRPEPDEWDEQRAHPSRPVVNVSWYQAMAFCSWLTDRLARRQDPKGEPLLPPGVVARLPTEAEWEYAARGAAGRRYPWGDEAPNAGRTNYRETRVGHAAPVGIFPGDRTPEGIIDLAGNTWDWCLDVYRSDFYADCQRQELLTDPLAPGDGGAPRVARGGAFDHVAGNLRAAARGRFAPLFPVGDVGFRCVLSAPRNL